MSRPSVVPSLVVPCGSHSGGHCGYCKGKNEGSHTTWGMIAKRLMCEDYQYLIDRGWRRSGTFCYKPINNVTCCPCYTIRCAAIEFRPSRSQKRVLKILSAFVRTGEKPSQSQLLSGDWRIEESLSDQGMFIDERLGCRGDTPRKVDDHSSKVAPALSSQPIFEIGKPELSVLPTGDSAVNNCAIKSKHQWPKARVRRWEAKKKRLRDRSSKEQRPFDDLLKEYFDRRAKRLNKNAPKDLETLLSMERSTCQKWAHSIELRLVQSSPPSAEFDATLEAECELFKKYQMAIHHETEDECTKEKFLRFLVKSPLVRSTPSQSVQTDVPSFGSYHHQYWLDGKQLIAVGVIDLLPRCLSSVYLFYDPAYAFLQLGTYSALREIALVRELARKFGPLSDNPAPAFAKFNSYYMGYYIRSCPKMAYKARFRPSYLACPITHTWVPVSDCLKRLDEAGSKFCRFSSPAAIDSDAITDSDSQINRYIRCRVKIGATKHRDRNRSQDEDTALYGKEITLEILSRFLSEGGVDLIRELTALIGRRVLSGHFHYVIP